MKEEKSLYYKAHLFICLKQKPEGKPCCADKGNENLWQDIKRRAKDRWGTDVRINSSQCLGRCGEGGIAVLYPQNIWFTKLHEGDVESLWQRLIAEIEV